MMAIRWLLVSVWILVALGGGSAVARVLEVPREYRGVWLATAWGLDWPSAKDAPATQQARLREILDRCADLNINVVHFQVRPASDAFYQSSLEPWSQWLTGTSGQAPKPFYDPLAFCIAEAHARGIEVHAWVNPFRAKVAGKATLAASHITRRRPDLCRTYGGNVWLDPGEPDAVAHVRRVIADIVARYDIDGLVFDDYFYPYPAAGAAYPDGASYAKYTKSGGKLGRADWRRQNVDNFVKAVYTDIKSRKRHVKFGISPFGIWRPGHPAGITGLDSYGDLYADSRRWLREGWCDVFSPQLYWKMRKSGQEYTKLSPWWGAQNPKRRVLVHSLNTYKVADASAPWTADDIISQVRFSRGQPGEHGNVHYRTVPFTSNKGGLNGQLKRLYDQPALLPAFTWLDNVPPAAPTIAMSASTVSWTPAGNEPAARWLVQWQQPDGKWRHAILPANARSYRLPGRSSQVAVAAVDRCWNLSRQAPRGPDAPAMPAPPAPAPGESRAPQPGAASLVIDNAASAVSYSGSWLTAAASSNHHGVDYRFASSAKAGAEARFNFVVPRPGAYRIDVWYPHGANRANNAPHLITHAGGTTAVAVNQQQRGGEWVALGVHRFAERGSVAVRTDGANPTVVIADAVRVTWVGP